MKLKRITITSIFINFALMLLILYAYRGKIENVLINRGETVRKVWGDCPKTRT